MLRSKNCIFSLACQTLTVAGLIYSVLLQVMLLLMCGSLKLTVVGVKLWTVLEPLPRKIGRWVFLHHSSCTVLNAISISAPYCWKIKLLLMTTFIASNICWDSKIPSNTVYWFSPQAWWRITSTFDTATDNATDMVIVQHVGDISIISNFLRSFWQWSMV